MSVISLKKCAEHESGGEKKIQDFSQFPEKLIWGFTSHSRLWYFGPPKTEEISVLLMLGCIFCWFSDKTVCTYKC